MRGITAISLLLLCSGISASADFACTQIPGKLKQIDAGNGAVYGVNSNDDIYSWTGNGWKYIPGKLMHISCGMGGVWGVNSAFSLYTFRNGNWVYIPGTPMSQVDAGGGILVGVDSKHNIYCLKRSCTMAGFASASLTSVPGSLMYYSCSPKGCWGVNRYNNIYYRKNVTPTACQGTDWQMVDGQLVQLEVASDGSVYGVNSAGDVYRRDGITDATPTGRKWTMLDLCAKFTHVTYDAGDLWLLTSSNDIYRCQEFPTYNQNT